MSYVEREEGLEILENMEEGTQDMEHEEAEPLVNLEADDKAAEEKPPVAAKKAKKESAKPAAPKAKKRASPAATARSSRQRCAIICTLIG